MSETPLDLDAIKARANAATPGPWSSDGDSLATYEPGDVSIWGYLVPELRRGIVFNVGSIITEVGYACEREREDADFIAAAREDVPALCDEVERLRKVIEDIGEYARAAYAEAAMRDHAGRSALNAIVNTARQTISKRKEVEK